MTRLFIIEAPGKARTLESTLQRLGFESKVQATKGHIYQMPEKLSDLGIDSSFRDFKRVPRELEVVQRLRREAHMASDVYIATDADAEGDVIAWDVSELISDFHQNVMRVRLGGMDDDSILEAIKDAKPVSKSDAVPGRTRALVDRLIGAGFSRDGVAVGRIGTALLGLIDKQEPSVFRFKIVAPAKDGGRPWVAEADTNNVLTRDVINKIILLDFPALTIKSSSPHKYFPSHTGDIMVRAGDELDMSPGEVSRSMQKMYEGGFMSYPRAGSRKISSSTARKMAAILKKAGYGVEEDNFEKKGVGDVHDAPYPIGKVDATKNPEKLGQDEGLRTMVARDLVKAGQIHQKESPVIDGIVTFLVENGYTRDIANAVALLPWSREVGPNYPGKNSWPESEIIVRRADTVLLERAVAANLGRASTWANHIETFMKRGLVDEDLRLTNKGADWIKASPGELLDPRLSAAIEAACEKYPQSYLDSVDREPWELNAERIVNALPPQIKNRLTSMISVEPPHAKVDPIVAYGDMPDLDSAVNEYSDASPGYAPRVIDEY